MNDGKGKRSNFILSEFGMKGKWAHHIMKHFALNKSLRAGLTSLTILLAGCVQPKRATVIYLGQDGTEVRRAELPLDNTLTLSYVSDLNDSARYLAGMPGGINSQLGAVRQTDRWKLHQANVNELWRQFSSYRQPRIDSFARRECGALRSQNTIFYPFSGPDILFASAFFPGATNYILCGLEGTDPLPQLANLSQEQRDNGLDGIYTSITTALNCSFFITKDMRVDLQRTEFKGTLPIMLVFLARLGLDIDSVTPINLTANGGTVEAAPGSTSQGFVIHAKSGFGHTKNIYYFRQNLADDGIASNPKFLNFVNSFGSFGTYVKSASYLMHSNEFSEIRAAILGRSAGILQDDSGIPFRFFQVPGWEVHLYGNYTGVLDIFQSYYQPELTAAYQQGHSVESIDFGVGYKFNAGQSNLLMAIKR